MIDLAAIRSAIDPKAPPTGNVRCPVHDDRTPSLSVSVSEAGKLLCHCYAGCNQGDVFAEVRRRAGHLLNGAERDFQRTRSKPRETVYEYTDAGGKPLARVKRTDLANGDKTFAQATPDGRGGWRWKGPKGATPLYRLPALAAAPTLPAVICEGEKACEAAQRLLGARYVATTYMGGAASVSKADLSPLAGRDVIVWPDADAEGRKAAATLVARLTGIAARVRMVRVDDLPAKADAVDVQWTPAEFEARLIRPSDAWQSLRVRRFADLRVNVGGDSYCVKALLPRPGLAMVYGASGSGKTFFASRAAFDMATGRDFLGLRTRAGRVAYIAAESPASVERRFAAWREREGVKDAALIVIDGDVNMLDPANVARIVERIKAEGGADLIVIDTAAQAAPGIEENSPEGMGALVGAMQRLRDALGACVLIVHHAGKDDARGARGHSSLRAAVDVEIEVRGQSGIRTAKVTKARDGEVGRELLFDLRPFVIGTDDDGEEVTTCEVLRAGAEDRPAPAREPTGANQRIVLAALREAIGEHGKRHGGSSVIPKGAKVIGADTLERYALPRLPQEASGKSSADSRRREALARSLATLQADGFVGVWNDLRWLR